MIKWFSFNQRTQRVEEVTPSEELFKTSPLLFWSRGMDEWQLGPKALEHFLKPPVQVEPPKPVVIPVVEEKKQKMGPFYKTEIVQPTVAPETPVPVFVPDEVAKTDPIKPLPEKKKAKKKPLTKKVVVQKPIKRKKISKHINLVTKKKKQRKKRRR